jgi:hypothetical protein
MVRYHQFLKRKYYLDINSLEDQTIPERGVSSGTVEAVGFCTAHGCTSPEPMSKNTTIPVT